MDGKTFSPGFRFSKIDAAVLFIGGYIGMDLAAVVLWPGIAICFVVANFFLFCNVVRMRRTFELIWSAIFILLMAATMLFDVLSWPVTFVISFVVTLLLVALELTRPSYHGAFWQAINPRLPHWWAEHK